MTEMFGEAWSPMSVPDLAPDDDDDERRKLKKTKRIVINIILFYDSEEPLPD